MIRVTADDRRTARDVGAAVAIAGAVVVFGSIMAIVGASLTGDLAHSEPSETPTVQSEPVSETILPSPAQSAESYDPALIPASAICPDGFTLAEDLSCVPNEFWDAPIKQEDDPDWDCTKNGNEACGVQIGEQWFVIQFDEGEPVSVRRSVGYPRG